MDNFHNRKLIIFKTLVKLQTPDVCIWLKCLLFFLYLKGNNKGWFMVETFNEAKEKTLIYWWQEATWFIVSFSGTL